MKMIVALMAATALLIAPPLAAQQQGHDQHSGGMQGMHGGEGMQHCADMMGGMSAAMALQHTTDLDLGPDQVTRLEKIQEEGRAAAHPHMKQAMEVRAEANRMLEADQPDLGAYEVALAEAADHMVQAHTAMAANMTEARAVLTAEQREELAEFSDEMSGTMGGMGHAGGAMHQGMQHGGMGGMMDCPLMQGLSEPGPADAGAE